MMASKEEGIFITSITQPAEGAIVVLRCPACHTTEFFVDRWAARPAPPGEIWYTEFECPKHFRMQRQPFILVKEPS